MLSPIVNATKFDTKSRAMVVAKEWSRFDRSGAYVVRVRTGDIVGYRITSVGTIGIGQTLIAIWDSGELLERRI